MIGLLQTLRNELENVAYSLNDIAGKAKCKATNKIVDIKLEKKVKQYEEEENNKLSEQNKSTNSTIALVLEGLSGDKESLSQVEELLKTNMVDFKEAIAKATPEQISELKENISRLDAVSSLLLTIRANTAQAIGEGSPIFYTTADEGSLALLAKAQGGVTGKDLVANLQKVNEQQDIQHANPQSINNPIPIQVQA